MTRLAPAEIRKHVKELRGWSLADEKITKTYRFRTYRAGIRLVNEVAELAEKANHHPDITISWRTVVLALTTQDEGGLTERHFRLAKQIDALRP